MDDSALVLAEIRKPRSRDLSSKQPRSEQRKESGYATTSGDIVFVLDADDALHPRAAEEVLRRWRSGLSKVQFAFRRSMPMARRLTSFRDSPTIILPS